mmetsp:Transcript_12007/g.29295  ORF Transcript_12007/g.29295 Transcript_12007/m.29295 type:complete len:201 (-) Transcript_12007:247-849(-)
MASASARTLVVDPFCFRQFDDPDYAGTRIAMSKAEFEERANAHFEANPGCLVDGYAPFCKHIFMDNCVDATLPYVELTPDLEPLVRSAYEARNDKELPVLQRWVPAVSVEPRTAKYLDLILYSREQIRMENAGMGEEDISDAPWGIISVKAQDVPHEVPMNPITMMRNALGVEQGGSGVAIEREKYDASVEFWEKHIVLR